MERVVNLVLFPILVELLWVSLHLSQCWLWACCKLPALCWGVSLVSLFSPGIFNINFIIIFNINGFHQQPFLHLMRWSCGFCFSVCLYGRLHLVIYIWTIPASLRRILLGHDRWSFWCVLGFILKIFYWELLQLCS